MGFSCGFVGLPNVGKTTLFNALTSSNAPAKNYPFCTVDPNHGIVAVPDARLDRVAEIFQPHKVTPTTLEFVDIAGLVKGASSGEGLGNQFLSHIQPVDSIVHIVRCFDDHKISHAFPGIDPVRDLEVVETELLIRDLESTQRRLEKHCKVAAAGDKTAQQEVKILERVEQSLAQGQAVLHLNMTQKDLDRITDTHLLTAKPYFIVANISDNQIGSDSDPALSAIKELAEKRAVPLVDISIRTEAELGELDPQDQKDYMLELGICELGLHCIIKAGYRLLGLITFFTTVGTEVKAWTVPANTPAIKAAGRIHSDMEKGFIRAEVITSEDLVSHGSEQALWEKGLMRLEGKDYLVRDGDIIRFRFNVG